MIRAAILSGALCGLVGYALGLWHGFNRATDFVSKVAGQVLPAYWFTRLSREFSRRARR